MMMRRTVLRTAGGALLGAACADVHRAVAALDDGDAVSFVKRVGDRLVAVINGPGSDSDKRAALTPIVDAAVDVDGVARFCLGRFWRTAGPEEQRQYVETFHAVLVNNIAHNMGDYKGVRFTVGRAQRRDQDEVVATTIELPDNKPSRVEWLIAEVGGGPKIEDMITEGVSLRVTERNDYASFLASNGHNVRTLIDSLRRKLAAHA